MSAKIIVLALVFDHFIGDPHTPYHPIALIGRLIARIESLLLRNTASAIKKRLSGIALVITVAIIIVAFVEAIYFIVAPIKYGRMIFSIFLIWSVVSPRALGRSGVEIADLIKEERIEIARRRLSLIVSRDTASLNNSQIAQGAIESIAENTVDALIAPIFYALLGGPLGAILYRTVNTMDSMVGYRNERYIDFGWAAARLDDCLNYLPARLCAFILALAALLAKKRFFQTIKTSLTDGGNHPSPNSGIAEASMAGALNIRLGGPIYYSGKKRCFGYLGDGRLPREADIRAAVKLLKMSNAIIILSLLPVIFISL